MNLALQKQQIIALLILAVLTVLIISTIIFSTVEHFSMWHWLSVDAPGILIGHN